MNPEAPEMKTSEGIRVFQGVMDRGARVNQIELPIRKAAEVTRIACDRAHAVLHSTNACPPQYETHCHIRKVQEGCLRAFRGQHQAPISCPAAIIENAGAGYRLG